MMQRLQALFESRAVRTLLLTVGAAVTALAVCFPTVGVLEWVSLVPPALVLFAAAGREKFSFRRSYLAGLGFFMVYYAIIFHWFFYMYPLEFLELSAGAAAVVVMVACFGLAFLQSLVSAFIFPLFFVAARGRLVKKCPILAPFLAAALWCISEWCLTLTWAGVPWSRLALGQMEMRAAVQTASLFGSYFVTFLIVAVNFLTAYAVYYHRRLAGTVAMVLFSANLLAGGILLAADETEGEPLRVAAVQGNVSSEDKWNDDKFMASLEIYTDYTIQAAREDAMVVVWPESVIPYDIGEMPAVDSYLRKLSSSTGTHLLVGGFREVDGLNYNAVYAYAPDGTLNETYYFKRHLVPFGEFLPMESLIRAVIPPLAELNAFDNVLAAGTDSNIIKTDVGNIGGLICFDSIYEELTRDSVRDGAQLIALSTNDSWFTDSAALHMHNRQAALRAIESGRYIVRSANTGISSIITPKGEILDSVGALEEGIAVADVYLRNGSTLYMRIGNLLIWLCIAFWLSALSYDVTVWVIEKKKVR